MPMDGQADDKVSCKADVQFSWKRTYAIVQWKQWKHCKEISILSFEAWPVDQIDYILDAH